VQAKHILFDLWSAYLTCRTTTPLLSLERGAKLKKKALGLWQSETQRSAGNEREGNVQFKNLPAVTQLTDHLKSRVVHDHSVRIGWETSQPAPVV